MEYMGDKEYWNDKFSTRGDTLIAPEKSLLQNINCFKQGSVLDIACGDGRNTLFLLKNGFRVTGIDFSSKALERLEWFAKSNNYPVNTKEIDLSSDNALRSMGIFDNVLINHYRLSSKHLMEIKNHITSEGILFVCGFGHRHKIDAKIRKEDLIQPTDFKGLNRSFRQINYIESQDARGVVVTYIFRNTVGGSRDIVNSRSIFSLK